MKAPIFYYLFFITLITSGCSLLKFSPEFGADPMPQRDLNVRMSVRYFYTNFSGKIVETADSIASLTNDKTIKAEVIKWKIGATSACANTAYQTDAEISLIDTWLLARQMDEYFAGAGKNVFGEHTIMAQHCATELHEQIDKIARGTNDKTHYKNLASFVYEQALPNDLYEWHFSRINTRTLLTQHLNIPDSLYTTTIGTGAEVMNDFTDRISAYNNQISSQLQWEKDLIVMTLSEDSIVQPYLDRVDSLSLMLNRLVIVAQESPEMLGVIAVRMREELSPLMHDFNSGMQANLAQLGKERALLQLYLEEQRIQMNKDIQESGKVLMQELTDNASRFIRNISWVIIILVIVFAGVLFGIPFFVGYLLAKARFKNKD